MSRRSLRGPAWVRLSAEVLERDGHQCVKCGATADLTVDHIVPLAAMDEDDRESGLDRDPDNLQTLCRSCNGRKQDRPDDGRTTWLNLAWFS